MENERFHTRKSTEEIHSAPRPLCATTADFCLSRTACANDALTAKLHRGEGKKKNRQKEKKTRERDAARTGIKKPRIRTVRNFRSSTPCPLSRVNFLRDDSETPVKAPGGQAHHVYIDESFAGPYGIEPAALTMPLIADLPSNYR